MKEIKISEVLHLAADKYLWDGCESGPGRYTPSGSCSAIWDAVREIAPGDYNRRHDLIERIKVGLSRLGLTEALRSSYQFQEFASGVERQGVRYTWLKMCALRAEEQGL